MPHLPHSYVDTGDEQFITVFVSGQVHTAHSSRTDFEKIVALTRAGDPSVVRFFDKASFIEAKLRHLSARVSVRSDTVYLDDVALNNGLTKQIVRFVDEDLPNWRPLVRFMEKIEANPVEASRQALYAWLEKLDFTINDKGNILGYKAVRERTEEDGYLYESQSTGKAISDGVEYDGRIPQNVGSVVEMPRPDVDQNIYLACSQGLHVGTFQYASHFGPVLLKVEVDPQDVVSVPADTHNGKFRTCRYEVLEIIDRETGRITSVYEGDEQEEEDGRCGDLTCESCYGSHIDRMVEAQHQNWGEQDDDEVQAPISVPFAGGLGVFPYPSQSDWDALVARQKSRRRPLVRLARAKGWVLVNPGEPKSRTSWRVG